MKDIIIRIGIFFLFIFSFAQLSFVNGEWISQPESAAYQNRYGRIKSYIPDSSSPVITIKLAFHFFQDKNYSNNWNFEKMPEQQTRFKQIVSWINDTYGNCQKPSDSIEGVPFINDSKIRFEVTGYYFYQNDELNKTTSRYACETAVKAADPKRLESFPIYFTAGKGAHGNAVSANEQDVLMNQSIITFNAEANPGGDYAMSQHLAHELGHALDLFHTYDGTQDGKRNAGDACCPELIDPKSPDYLWDIFEQPWKNWCNNPDSIPCYHQNGFSCDAFGKNNYCTNNLMGGSNWNNYISPLQMGKMHRALSLMSIRKYVKEMESSDYDWIVSEDETWDFDIQMYRNILVTNGATLTITKKVAMANNAKIIVDKGSSLIVKKGKITSWCEAWDGIKVKSEGNLTLEEATIDHVKNAIQLKRKANYKLSEGTKILEK